MRFYPHTHFNNTTQRVYAAPVEMWVEVHWDPPNPIEETEEQFYLLLVMKFRGQKFVLQSHEITEAEARESEALDRAVHKFLVMGEDDTPDETQDMHV